MIRRVLVFTVLAFLGFGFAPETKLTCLGDGYSDEVSETRVIAANGGSYVWQASYNLCSVARLHTHSGSMYVSAISGTPNYQVGSFVNEHESDCSETFLSEKFTSYTDSNTGWHSSGTSSNFCIEVTEGQCNGDRNLVHGVWITNNGTGDLTVTVHKFVLTEGSTSCASR